MVRSGRVASVLAAPDRCKQAVCQAAVNCLLLLPVHQCGSCINMPISSCVKLKLFLVMYEMDNTSFSVYPVCILGRACSHLSMYTTAGWTTGSNPMTGSELHPSVTQESATSGVACFACQRACHHYDTAIQHTHTMLRGGHLWPEQQEGQRFCAACSS